MIYRVKQFIWSIIYFLKKIDEEYLDKYLNKEEKRVFENLKKSEQQHSIRVCKEAIYILRNNKKYIELNEKEVGKASLLHDIGKTKHPINLIEKSLLVILSKITKGKIKRFSNIKCVDTYYNHPIYSIEILNAFIEGQYSKNFIDAIKNHHFNNISYNNLLNILREADNKC